MKSQFCRHVRDVGDPAVHISGHEKAKGKTGVHRDHASASDDGDGAAGTDTLTT